jgi:IclR family acetate operon transcriptional repressor
MAPPRVQSLDRALDLLEALASAGELGVSDLAARTGLVPSTAHRLLSTLVERGYAAQSAAGGRYLIGYKLLELASGLQDRVERLRLAAREHLEAIQRETGETTNLVVLEGREVVYVDKVDGTRSVRLFLEVGRAIPAHTSGAGKAILAWRSEEDVAALLGGAPLARSTRHTITTLDGLHEEFARIRRRGFATDNEEHEDGVACVGTPVFDHRGLAIAALSVSGPTLRLSPRRVAELRPIVIKQARALAELLGHRTEGVHAA